MSKQAGGDKTDFESNVLYMAIGALLVAIGLWFFVGAQIVAWIGILRRYELVPFAQFFERAELIYSKLVEINGGVLDFKNSIAMLSTSGEYVRWLYLPVLPILGFVLLTKSTRLHFQKQHSMSSLAKQESVIWPEISPIVGKQNLLLNGDDHNGEWAVALTEWEFAEKHKLASRLDAKVDRDAARAVFVTQLGPLWSGAHRLPTHRKALYAVFLLRIAAENHPSENGQGMVKLRLMAKTFAAGGLKGMDTSFADGVIAKYGNLPNIQRAIGQHAYVSTLMATLLQLSRADGVLASPMFIWLKTVDRDLWYLLNNVGRYAFHVECSGAASHWLFEKTVSQACHTPMVEKAIDGLAMALTEFTEDDSLDRLYK